MRLRVRFTLLMSLALLVVMSVAGFLLYKSAARLAASVQERTLIEAAELTAQNTAWKLEAARLKGQQEAFEQVQAKLVDTTNTDLLMLSEDLRVMHKSVGGQITSLGADIAWEQVGDKGEELAGGAIQRVPIRYGGDQPGFVYRRKVGLERPFDLLAPANVEVAQKGLMGLIAGIGFLVVLVGAIVSVFVANQVSNPLEEIVQDVRQISTGDLRHRTRARGGGEIELLAKSIDRMTHSLAVAQETELELSIREREVEVAAEVREALMPIGTPAVRGYAIDAFHMQSDEMGGDFHTFIELPDGRIGTLVCDVSGRGVPGALVGAMARSLLRAELARGADLSESLFSINRQIARDVRRGMFVSALYCLLEPGSHRVQVVCAGHKVPLVRFTAADQNVRLVQPEGIALGFDKGPIFERALQVADVTIEPGDRLVLANSGPVVMISPEGVELGEKPFYGYVKKFGPRPNAEFLERLRTVFESYSDGAALPRDISVLSISRT
jgi:HAMP domain-containing protein/type II secretory pathway pseudopilin PulG